MRPIPGGDDAFPSRSRSTSFTDNTSTPVPGPHQAPQMSYFLADEKTMETSRDVALSSHRRSRESMKRIFGIDSLETSRGSLTTQDNGDQGKEVGKAHNNWKMGSTKGLAGKT